MPQIAQLAETWSSQVFWLLLIFGFVFFVIGRGMVPKVLATVEQRDGQIASDLAAAQAARDASQSQEADWRARETAARAEAQGLVGDARASAQTAAEARLAEVQSRLDGELSAAETRIQSARDAAAAEIETIAAEAAQSITQRLAGIDVSEAAARAAVQKALAHG